MTFVTTFEANGLLSTAIELYNLKRHYYDSGLGVMRLAFEICFAILLLLYLLLEMNKIWIEIATKRDDYEKREEENDGKGEKTGSKVK